MIKFNIKNILKSPMYALGVAFIVLVYLIVQIPEMLSGSGPLKFTDLTFLSNYFGYSSYDGKIVIVLLFSLLMPALIVFIGTYDNIYGKKYVEEYVIPRIGKQKYFRSRAIAIGIVTALTFIIINFILVMMLAIRYGISFTSSYDISLVGSFTTMTGVTIIISMIIQSVTYGIVAIGIFILSQMISTKRFIDTLVLIQVAVLGLHLVLLLTGELFNYAGVGVGSYMLQLGEYSWQYIDVPIIKNAFIGNAMVFNDLSMFMGDSYYATPEYNVYNITLPNNMYLSHILSSLFTVFFVILVYVGIPLAIYKLKQYLDYKKTEDGDSNYATAKFYSKYIRKDKLISYALYFIPVLIFMYLLRIDILNEINSYGRPASSIDAAESLTFTTKLDGLSLFAIPVLFVIIVYQVLREIDIHLDGQVYIRMVRHDSKQKYFINVAKIAILKVLPYIVIFTYLFITVLPKDIDYSNVHLVIVPILMSFVTLAILAALMRSILPIYPALISVGFIVAISFVTQALLSELLSEIISAKILIVLIYLVPIYNYQAIYLRQDIENDMNWQNGIDEEAILHSPITLYIVIALQVALFTYIFVKVATKKYKELK